ncbi:MAG: hypothetical protein ABR878_13440 [Roseiarcus sp.]
MTDRQYIYLRYGKSPSVMRELDYRIAPRTASSPLAFHAPVETQARQGV